MNKHRLPPRWAAHDRSETQWTAPTWIATATCLPVSLPWTTRACARECWPPPACRPQPGRSALQERGCSLLLRGSALVERFDIEPYSDFQPNDQTVQGSFSSVSTPNFAKKYSLESSWRDLQNLIKIYMLLHRSDLNIFQQNVSNFFAFLGKFSKN